MTTPLPHRTRSRAGMHHRAPDLSAESARRSRPRTPCPPPHRRPVPAARSSRRRVAPELAPGKLLAGAGAAATSAVIGSSFGADGTVLGAALGSAISTIAAVLYQRWLEHAGRTVRARLVVGRKQVDPLAGPGVSAATLGPERAAPQRRTRRGGRVGPTLAAAVGGFVLAMAGVTGAELVHGTPLGGGSSGTSIGTVVSGGERAGGPPPTTAPGRGSVRSPGGTVAPTPVPVAGPAPGAAADDEGRTEAGPTATPDRAPRTTTSPTPSSTTPTSATDGGGGIVGTWTSRGTTGPSTGAAKTDSVPS